MSLEALPTAEDELGSVVDHVDTVDAAKFNTLRRLIEALSLTAPRDFPAGSANGIRIDPANGRIEFRGTARPTTMIQLAYEGAVGSASPQGFTFQSDSTIQVSALVLTDGSSMGAKFRALEMPDWVDLSEPIEFYVWMQNVAFTDGDVVMEVAWDRARNSATTVVEAAATKEVVYSGVATDKITRCLAGTVPASTFQANDLISFMVRRIGGDAADTHTNSIRLAHAGFLSVRRKYLN